MQTHIAITYGNSSVYGGIHNISLNVSLQLAAMGTNLNDNWPALSCCGPAGTSKFCEKYTYLRIHKGTNSA